MKELDVTSKSVATGFRPNDQKEAELRNPVTLPRVSERLNATEAECAVLKRNGVDPVIQTSGTVLDSTVCEPSLDTVSEKSPGRKTVDNLDEKLSSFAVKDRNGSPPYMHDSARDNRFLSEESQHEHTKKAQITSTDPVSVAFVVDDSRDLSRIEEALENLKETKADKVSRTGDTEHRIRCDCAGEFG